MCVALKNCSWYWINPKGMRSRGMIGVLPSSFLSAMQWHKKYTTLGLSWASNSRMALQAMSRNPLTFQESPVFDATLHTRLSATVSSASREAILANEDSRSFTVDTHIRSITLANIFCSVDWRSGTGRFCTMLITSIDCWLPVNLFTVSIAFSGIAEKGTSFSLSAAGTLSLPEGLAKYEFTEIPYASSASSTVLNLVRKTLTTLCRIDCAVKIITLI